MRKGSRHTPEAIERIKEGNRRRNWKPDEAFRQRAREMQATHWHSSRRTHSLTYSSWHMMRQRCLNPNATGYERYGGRGITVHEPWKSFVQFLADMGERPPGTELDRIDSDGPYSPENCRWLEREENSRRGAYRKHELQKGVA